MNMIASTLMGAHRTGKTYLAKLIAEKHGLDFLSGSFHPVYEKLNIQMGDCLIFDARIELQECALAVYKGNIERQIETGRSFISDRCFLDLIGYTLAEYPSNPSMSHSTWIESYIAKCLSLNKRYYDHVVMLRPGITIIEDDTSWAGDFGVVNKVDACMLWAAEKYNVSKIIPRGCS